MLISFQSIERLVETSRQAHIRLDVNAVHLWGIALDGSSRCLEQCAHWLDEVERHRATRFIREEIRHRYVLAHGGLRAVLSQYLGINPDAVALERSATGKPSLTRALRDLSAITFNLSHAHGRALIAVSRAQEVGVDLELVRSDVEATKLSERYFARSEHRAIMHATEEQRATKFFRYWVAKEALLKAQGIGLSGLPDCEIFLGEDRAETDPRVRLGAQFTAPLRVRLLTCERRWEAAVAAQDLASVTQCPLPSSNALF
jgi:4'-phosphopantetheinyl transferase